MEIFSQDWARQWREEINSSDAYRNAAKGWNGSLALRMKGPRGKGGSRGVFVDLGNGGCTDGRVASQEDLAAAQFVMSADAKVWREVLDGRFEPVLGIMTGRLKLERGKISELVPWVKAAKELVAAAGRVGGNFPTA